LVIKRSMSAGFAGIDNRLYYMDRTPILYGDVKSFLTEMVKELPARVRAVAGAGAAVQGTLQPG
jgi:hypothetical protein